VSNVLRPLGFLLCAVAAVAVFVLLAPKVSTSTPTLPSATRYETLITQALADDAANNLRTEGAPQQQVVNGWTAKDLLTIIAKQNIDILTSQGAVVDATGNLQTAPFDQRIPALLLIAVVALCWSGIATPRPIRDVAQTAILPPPTPTPAPMPAV
jgi:hypothetical protein